eukprot:GDKI01021562.1.p1 GENE.GDKI01021562.1~~GDKI01021562.1.p1  ORF type:complete len:212 (-),score=59.91 GDKI01021562.1:136-771(-)
MVSPVFFYVPNLIGYGRVALAFAAYMVAYQSWQMFIVFYGISQILDAVDGVVARKLGQSTKFGAVLDQVTDRFSTAALLMINATLYKSWYMAFISVVVLDITAHWFQMYSSVVCGLDSHKQIPASKPILKFYYEYPGAMLVAHTCNEVFWLALYCAARTHVVEPTAYVFFQWAAVIVAPFMLFKQLTNFLQLFHASEELAAIDDKARAKRK